MFFKRKNTPRIDTEATEAYSALAVAEANLSMAEDEYQQEICFYRLQEARARVDYIIKIKKGEIA